MALGGQVHHRIRPVRGEDLLHCRKIGDIGAHQNMPRVGARLLERILGRGVGHPIHIDDAMVGAADQVPHHGGTDEAASAGQKNPHH